MDRSRRGGVVAAGSGPRSPAVVDPCACRVRRCGVVACCPARPSSGPARDQSALEDCRGVYGRPAFSQFRVHLSQSPCSGRPRSVDGRGSPILPASLSHGHHSLRHWSHMSRSVAVITGRNRQPHHRRRIHWSGYRSSFWSSYWSNAGYLSPVFPCPIVFSFGLIDCCLRGFWSATTESEEDQPVENHDQPLRLQNSLADAQQNLPEPLRGRSREAPLRTLNRAFELITRVRKPSSRALHGDHDVLAHIMVRIGCVVPRALPWRSSRTRRCESGGARGRGASFLSRAWGRVSGSSPSLALQPGGGGPAPGSQGSPSGSRRVLPSRLALAPAGLPPLLQSGASLARVRPARAFAPGCAFRIWRRLRTRSPGEPCSASTTLAARVASFEDVTRLPQKGIVPMVSSGSGELADVEVILSPCRPGIGGRLRGAAVKAVSPAERGRSAATRLDGGEHRRRLSLSDRGVVGHSLGGRDHASLGSRNCEATTSAR